MLNSDTINKFQQDGYLVLDGILKPGEAVSIIDCANRLSSLLFPSHDTQGNASSYLNLVKSNRKDAGKIFDSLVKIPAVNQILYSHSLENIAKQLLQSSLVLSSPTQMNLRSDHPSEERFLYPWHTDYIYNFGSSNSLVFWIPLQEVDNVNGCLHIIPGSHRVDAEIDFNEDAFLAKSSAEYFHIRNMEDILSEMAEIRCPLKLGQAVVFHSKLIHKSGENFSSATRFALQSRWFDAMSTDAIENRFVGGIDEGRNPKLYL
jgi:phytanoyl-CoA hydroxylase